MINPHDNYWIPSDGYKYISNGVVWTDSIYLGDGANISAWHETNDEPQEPIEPTDEAELAEAARILLGVSE